MKRTCLIGAAILLAFLLPKGRGTDLSELIPVEILYVDRDEQGVRMATDLGVSGVADSIEGALADMEKTAPGTLFLDTAEYLLVTERALPELTTLVQTMRPSVKLLLVTQQPQWDGLAAYLQGQKPEVTLLDYRSANTPIPMLVEVEGRYYIV